MSIFSKIINREIPAFIIDEDTNHIAFLDINPLAEGHTLVIPKKEIDYIFDLEDNELAALNIFAKKVAQKIKNSISCKRVGIAVIGLEVPHAHIHLVPLQSVSDINFARPKLNLTSEQLRQIQSKICQ